MSRSIVRDALASRKPVIVPTRDAADGCADLAAAHAEISALPPLAVAELIVALCVDVRRLDEADATRVRLAAIRLAHELQGVAA